MNKEKVLSPKDEARAKFKAKLTYTDIIKSDIQMLKELLNSELANFENAAFKMHLNKTVPYIHNVYKNGILVSYSIRCTGIIQYENQEPIVHFEDREAITFNRDGFIGFCGWADRINSKPFLEAFNQWVDRVKPIPF